MILEKKYILWRNISSLKVRFSDENIRWRKTFITYHFLLVTKNLRHLSLFFWWRNIFIKQQYWDLLCVQYYYTTRHLYCSTHAMTSEKIGCYLLVRLYSLSLSLFFFFILIRGLRTLLLSCVCTISNWLLTNTKVRFKTQFCLI